MNKPGRTACCDGVVLPKIKPPELLVGPDIGPGFDSPTLDAGALRGTTAGSLE